MPENQSLGVVMDNQQPVENKIHIQALHQPDPDFFDDSDQIKNILELIEVNKVISDMAYFVYTKHETNRWARAIYDATIKNII